MNNNTLLSHCESLDDLKLTPLLRRCLEDHGKTLDDLDILCSDLLVKCRDSKEAYSIASSGSWKDISTCFETDLDEEGFVWVAVIGLGLLAFKENLVRKEVS